MVQQLKNTDQEPKKKAVLDEDVVPYIETVENGRRIARDVCTKPCPVEIGMRILGGKWTGSILWNLQYAPVRFNDLARMIAGASKKVISERLRQLETEGLINRQVMNTSPVAVEYSLTPFGETALACLGQINEWAKNLPELRNTGEYS